jgi:oligopeptide/dipeptide ABC transporter ATP-binding protein
MKGLSQDFGTSILLITHDLGVVAEMCDRVAVMYAGYIIEQGTVDDIFFNTNHPYTQGLLNAIPKMDVLYKERLQPIVGNVPSLVKMPSGCRFAARCPRVIDQCRYELPPLFEVGESHLSRCWLHNQKEA